MQAKQNTRSIVLCALLFCGLAGMDPSAALAQYGYNPSVSRPRGVHTGGGFSGGQGYHRSNYPSHNRGQYGQRGNSFYGGFGNYGQSGFGIPYYPQNFNYGYYQRPYPYHLDYYRMRYGGSYEPYAGNLYGPPMVQAPTYVAPTTVNPAYDYPPDAGPQEAAPPYVPSAHSPASVRNYGGAYYW
jgi:hypothetical protein